jgi:hypothetical protein
VAEREPTDHEVDELLRRVRSGVGGVRPRHDALDTVHRQVARRRRRRRTVQAVAAVAAAAVVVPVAVLALRLGDGTPPVDPAVTPSDGSSDGLNGERPAAFFVSLMGGRSRAQVTRYRAAVGERYQARFIWWPDADGEVAAFSGAALETYDGDPQESCEALAAENEAEDPAADATCTTTSDGQVVRLIDTTANGLRLDPLNRRGRLADADPDDAVRAATVFREDGWAVTLVICACRPWGAPDLDEPPVDAGALADAAGHVDWIVDPEKRGRGDQRD